jgi:hypothetical protein
MRKMRTKKTTKDLSKMTKEEIMAMFNPLYKPKKNNDPYDGTHHMDHDLDELQYEADMARYS